MENKILFKTPIKWIAHRGLSYKAFQNSYTAIKLAAKLPFYGIETDVHETLDHVFVIHHDESMLHTTGVDVKINQSTYEDLSKLTYKNTDEHIVLFEDYLKLCKTYQKKAIIELKPLFTSEMIASLLDVIKSNDYLEHCIFISFELANLLRLRRINKDVSAQLLVTFFDDIIMDLCLDFNFELNIDHIILNQALVDQIHQKGIKINCWTIRNKHEAIAYMNLGVDYITTDGFDE